MEELIPMTLFMCVAAVLILRPLTKRMGALLEAMTRERLQPPTQAATTVEPQLTRVANLLEQVVRRQDALEERLDFTERLLSSGHRTAGASQSVGGFDDVRLGPKPLDGFHG